MKQKHFKNIIQGSFFNIITVYFTFFLGMLRLALFSRLLTPEEFGYLLSSFSIVLIFQVIHWFLPPGLNSTILYYLPKSIKERNSQRNFMISTVLIRIASICAISTIYYFSVEFLFRNTSLLLSILRKFGLLLILYEFIRTFSSIVIGFQKYRLYAILMIVRDFLITILLIFGIFYCSGSCLDFVINTLLFSNFTIFIILIIFLYHILRKTKIFATKFKFYYNFSKFSLYGLPIALIYFFDLILKDFNRAMLVYFKEPFEIVLYSISQNASQMVSTATGTSAHLISAYSETDSEATDTEVNQVFLKMIDFLGFLATFIMLIIFIFADIYVELIYTSLYLEAILLIRIMIVSGFIYFLIDYFSLYFKFKGITGKLLLVKAIFSLIWLISSIISIIFLNILWVVISNTLIQVINLLVFLYFIKKIRLIQKGFINIFKILGIYFVSILIIIFNEIVLASFSSQTLINLIIVKIFNFFISLIVILALNWKLRIITRDSLSTVIELKIFTSKINKLIKKFTFLLPLDRKKG